MLAELVVSVCTALDATGTGGCREEEGHGQGEEVGTRAQHPAGLSGAGTDPTDVHSCRRWQQPAGLVPPAQPELILPLQLLQTFGRKRLKQRGFFFSCYKLSFVLMRHSGARAAPLPLSGWLGRRAAEPAMQVQGARRRCKFSSV